MKSKLSMVFRLLLGLILFVFGLNKLFHFIPMDSPVPGSFMEALFLTGYMFPLIAITEIVAGFLLIINKFVGLALILAAVIIVNIVAFHLFLNIEGIGLGALMMVFCVYLFYSNWRKFKTLF